MDENQIKKIVREGYADVARGATPCCQQPSSCCGGPGLAESISRRLGYDEKDLEALPEGADLGLGCGNPVALASLRPGEVVLDLGSGAGIDCFLAAARVGESGKVIGVDMTPEMLYKARENAKKTGYSNVEFRLGEIENLPVADDSVDVIISNCVINLSPDKEQVFREAYRVLKPGGRLMVSDIVLLKELPDSIRCSVEAYVGCIAGAMLKPEYLAAIEKAGFSEVRVVDETVFPVELMANDPTAIALAKSAEVPMEDLKNMASSVLSVKVQGVKPRS